MERVLPNENEAAALKGAARNLKSFHLVCARRNGSFHVLSCLPLLWLWICIGVSLGSLQRLRPTNVANPESVGRVQVGCEFLFVGLERVFFGPTPALTHPKSTNLP